MSEVAIEPGDWVLFRTDRSYEPVRVDMKQSVKATAKLVYFVGDRHPRQCSRLGVVAATPDKAEAERMRDAIAGVAGEFQNRRRRAQEDCAARVLSAREAADKQIERIVSA